MPGEQVVTRQVMNCKFSANLASQRALTGTRPSQGFPAGGAYASYSMAFHEFIGEHLTRVDCDV